jgi:hypothetical protein
MAIDPGAISGAYALFLTSGEVVLGELGVKRRADHLCDVPDDARSASG